MKLDKLNGLMRLKLNSILEPFNTYGLDVHIPPAQGAIMELLEWYYQERKKTDGDS